MAGKDDIRLLNKLSPVRSILRRTSKAKDTQPEVGLNDSSQKCQQQKSRGESTKGRSKKKVRLNVATNVDDDSEPETYDMSTACQVDMNR